MKRGNMRPISTVFVLAFVIGSPSVKSSEDREAARRAPALSATRAQFAADAQLASCLRYGGAAGRVPASVAHFDCRSLVMKRVGPLASRADFDRARAGLRLQWWDAANDAQKQESVQRTLSALGELRARTLGRDASANVASSHLEAR